MLHTNLTGCKLLFRCCLFINKKIKSRFIMGESMKSLFAILLAITALNVTVVYADDALPEIAPVDDPAPPPLDAPAE